MKKEYDFSKSERGKFYNPDAEHNLPIYLDPAMMEDLSKLSKQKGVDVTALLNEWIKKDLLALKIAVK